MENTKLFKERVLVVDDAEINRSILADMLSEEFEVLEAENGVEAIVLLQKYGEQIALVLLDIVMPQMDGFDVLRLMNRDGWIENTPVIIISSEYIPAYMDKAYEMGASDYINRPFDARVVYRRVKNTILLYAKQKRLTNMMAAQMHEKEKNSVRMIEILSNIVEFRNGENSQHVLHIHTLTDMLLRRLVQKTNQYHLSQEDIMLISTASALHDIGKITIPQEILNKPGPLDQEEFSIMRQHAQKGADMLEMIPMWQQEPLLRTAHEICRWHHERYDGRGYPDGLAGEEIPISAQVVGLADVYDALVSKRAHKEPLSHRETLAMICDNQCGAFQPLLVECLLDIGDQIPKELEQAGGHASSATGLTGMGLSSSQSGELPASLRTLNLLEHERVKYQFYASMSREIHFEYDAFLQVFTLSEWGAKELGIPAVMGNPMTEVKSRFLIAKEDLQLIVEKLRKSTPEEPVVEHLCPIRFADRPRWSKVICRSMWSGEEKPRYTGAIGKLLDVDDERNRMNELEKIATRDPLTGLLNHANAQKRIGEILATSADRKYVLAILDLDFFKEANDKRGHLFGDGVLKYVAKRMQESIRSADLAARVGGDEFLIFMECANDREKQMERILRSLTGKYEDFVISISMGVAVTGQDATDYQELFQCADCALYMAKRQGRNRCCFYDNTMENTLSVLSPIESEERVAE